MRPVVEHTINRVLACGQTVMVFATFEHCNEQCSHSKKSCFSYQCRLCNTYGKKLTLPPKLEDEYHLKSFNRFLNRHYQKQGIVYFRSAGCSSSALHLLVDKSPNFARWLLFSLLRLFIYPKPRYIGFFNSFFADTVLIQY